ncbi:hypothetical protein BgiBS90_003557 [Biomphalaria glabrata]|nr:hypothetical protein BgiBS90_003557 [Biomphalaria glabrata]
MSSKSNVMMTRYPPTRQRATSWKPRSKHRGLEPRKVYLAEESRGTQKSNPVLKTRRQSNYTRGWSVKEDKR